MKILKSTEAIPVSASYAGDPNISFNGSNDLIESNDGYRFYQTSIINSFLDVKSNKHTLMGLTSPKNSNDLLVDTAKSAHTLGPLMFTSLSNVSKIIGATDQYDLVLVNTDDSDAILMVFDYVETISGAEHYKVQYRNTAMSLDSGDEFEFRSYNGDDDQIFSIQGGATVDSFTLRSKDGRYGNINGNSTLFVSRDNVDYIDLIGASRKVAHFNGNLGSTTSCVRYGNTILNSQTEMTLILEAKFISDNTTNYGRFLQCNLTYTRGVSIQRLGSSNRVYVRIDTSGGTNQNTYIGDVYDDDKFHIIAVVINNGLVKCYLDGVLTYTNTYNQGAGISDNSYLYLGSEYPNGGSRGELIVSRFIAYDKALNTNELLDAMTGVDYHDPKILSTYSEGSGTVITDYSGNSNNGTLITTDLASFWGDTAVVHTGGDGSPLNGTCGDTSIDGYNSTNMWVRYQNFYAPEYSVAQSILAVDTDGCIPDIKTNYLLNAPLESIVINGDSATIPFDIIPTKNFKTVASELSLIPVSGVSGADLVDFRSYNRIFTGGNQVEGYSNINLGYESEYSSALEFKADVFTYFHYPVTAPVVYIRDAGFEFAGAFAGIVPEYSDRIYKRLAGYQDKVWWGGGSHNGVQDGTWLCSWLSGGDNDTSTWIERYYDPGQITSDDALSFETSGYSETINFTFNPIPVQDVPSTMTLEPGAYYKYYHVGSGGIEALLQSLKGITDDKIVIQLSNFNTGDVVNDDSSNNNDGVISNFDNVDVVTLDIGFGSEDQSAVLLNKNSDIRVNSSPTLNVTVDKSITSWVYLRDWKAGRSTALFSNYYKGGDKFEFINHGLYYSYIVPDAEASNERFTIIPSEVSLSADLIEVENIAGIPVSVGVDQDGYHWVATYNERIVEGIPSDQTILFKLTPSGKVLESITVDDFKVDQLLIFDENSLYIFGVNGTIKTFNLHTGLETAQRTGASGRFYYIDMNNSLQSSPLTKDLDLFTDGTVCRILTNGSIVIGNQATATAPYTNETTNHICCDDDSYYFITTIDNYNFLTLRKIGKRNKADVQTFIAEGVANASNIPFISKESVDGIVRTVVYWIGHNFIKRFYIDDTGEMIELTTIPTSNFLGEVHGDFSGYIMNKRTSFRYNNSNPYLKYSLIIDDADEPKRFLIHSSEDLTDNWHYFAIIKDSDSETVSLYVDGEFKFEQVEVDKPILYLTGSMLNIGGSIDGSEALFDILGLKDRTIDGGVSEFVIFNTALDADDVKGLYISKFTSNNNMRWVMNNGKKNFVEEVRNVFRFKKPGIKSQFFNVIIRNIDLTDDEKSTYEAYIRSEIGSLLPANTKLVNVIWR